MAPISQYTFLPKRCLLLLLICCSFLALVCFAFPTAQAGTTWDGSGANTNINTAANWDLDTLPTSLTDGSQTLTFGTGGSTATINTDVSALGLIINRDANFEIANGAGNLTIGTGGITVTLPNTTARTHTISESNITLSGSQTWSVTNNTGAATLNVSSVISGVNTTLTKSGNGSLTLSGNNAYTGITTVSAGNLTISNANALGATGAGNGTTVSGTTTRLQISGGVAVSEAITLSTGAGGNINMLRSISGSNTLSGAINITGANRPGIWLASGNLTLTGGVTADANQNFILTNENSAASGNLLTISGSAINIGTGTLEVDGAGWTALNVAGNTMGTLNIRWTGQLRTGVANAWNSSLNLNIGSEGLNSGTNTLDIGGYDQTVGSLVGSTTSGQTNTLTNSGSAATFTVNQSTNTTYDGRITGAIALAKQGTGTLTLSGSSSYTGATTVSGSGSILAITNANALGATSGTTTVGDRAELRLSGGISVGESITLNGYGAVRNSNAALTNTSGTNTVTGAITLGTEATENWISSQAGTLNLTGGVTSSNRSLTLTGAGTGVINVTTNKINLGTGSLTVFAMSGTPTVSIGVADNTAGQLTVNYGGNLRMDVANAFSSSTGLAMGSSDNSTGSLDLNGNSQTFGSLRSDGTGTVVITSASAATLSVNQTVNNTYRGTITGAVGLTKSGSSTLTLSGNNTYSGATTVNAGTLLISGNGTLGTSTISISGGTLDMGGKSLSNTFGSLTAGTLSNGTLTNNGGNYDLQNGTVSAILAGTNGVNKTTSGTVTLSGANNYAGTTTISQGVLTITSNSSLPGIATNGRYSVANGATLGVYNAVTDADIASMVGTTNFAGGSAIGFDTTSGSRTYSSNLTNTLQGALGLTKLGSNTLTLDGSNTYTGVTTINAGTLQIGAGSTTGSLSSSSAITNNATLAINRSDNLTLGNVISGSGNLTKSGAGDLTLSGNNSYTGGTRHTNGNLIMGANNALGNGALTFNATATARLNLNSTNQTITGLTVLGSTASVIQNEAAGGGTGTLTFNIADGVTSSSASNFYFRDSSTGVAGLGKLALVKTGNGTLDFSTYNAINYSGGLTVNGGVFSYNATAALGPTNNLITLGGGTLNYTGASGSSVSTTNTNMSLTAGTTSTLNNANGTVTISAAIAGSGNLIKSGAGTLTLSGANTYNGSTTINAGTLSTSAADRISDSSAVTVASGATFLLGGSETVGSIAGAGNYSIAGFTLTAGGDNTSTTVSGNISGASGALTKTGSGTLTLNGTNTYTGATTINAGTLTISGGAAIADTGTVTLANASGVAFNVNSSETIASLQGGGASGGNVTIASGQTLTVAEANTNTFGGSLQGAGNFTKSGLGTLTLNGTNTNSGAVSVTGGTVLLSGANALSGSTSLLSAASSTTISLADGVGRTITLSTGNLSLSSATMVFELGTTSDRLTLTSGAVTLSGTNTISLANLGSFTAGNYTLISAASGLNGGTWSLNSAAGPTGFTYSLNSTATTLSLIATANSNNFYWTGNASTNWSGNNFSATDGGASTLSAGNFSATSDLIFAAAGASNLTTTMNSNYTVNSLAVSTPGVSIGGANTLTVNSTSSSAIAVSATSGNTTISANLAGASAGLTKTNSGTLILSGSNTYNGTTTLSGGVLNIQHANALGSTANGTTVATGAALQLQGGITVGAEALSLSGAGVSADGALRNISGNNIYGGAITLATTTRINSDSGLLTLSGGISGAQDLTIGGAGNTTISNAIATSTGALTKDGLGTLTLSASNTYTGATTINAGTLSIAAITNGGVSGALGNSSNAAGNLVLGGGTLEYTGSANGSTNRDFTLTAGTTSGISVTNSTVSLTISGNAASTNGALTKSGAGTLVLTGNNTYSGGTTINAGTLQVASTGQLGGGNYAGNIVNNGTFTYNGSNSQTLSGIISGNGTFIKNNSSTLTLSGNNSFTGAVYATAGYLNVNHNNALGANSGTVFTDGGGTNTAVRLNGGVTVSGKTLQVNGAGLSSEGQLVVNDGTTNTWAGLINVGGTSRIGIASNAASRLNLTGGITATGNQQLTLIAKAGTISVTGSAINLGSGGTLQISNGSSRLGVASGASNWGLTRVDFGGQLVTDVSNALAANAVLALGASGDAGSSTGSLDLNGFSQTVGGLRSGNVAGGEAVTGGGNRTITSASAATLTVNETSTNLYDGQITGAVALTKNGAGNLTLSGNNTYTGATTVNAGTLLLSGNGTLGTSTLSISGGTLDMGGKSLTNTFGSLTGGTLANGTLTNNGGNYDLQNGTVSAVLAGTNGVNKTGSGTVTLSNANNYSGTTSVGGGTLLLSSAGTLGTSTISISGGTLDMGGKSLTNTFSSLTGGTLANGTLTNNGGNYDLQNGTVSAVLAGTNGVNKTGSGTVTLSNANTYNGTTTVTSGTLRAAATGALANTSSIDVNGGSLLVAVANSVNDNANITLRNGGRLAVNGTFDETVGALTLSANSTIDFSGFVGTLRFGSIASWATGATLSIWNWSGQTQHGTNYGTYPNSSNLVFTNNATLTNNLANISFYSDSGTTLIGSGYERGFTGGGTEIIAVPEPETYVTGVILLLGGTIYLFRRAKHREGHRPAWPKFLHGIRQTTPRNHLAQKPPDSHPVTERLGPITPAETPLRG